MLLLPETFTDKDIFDCKQLNNVVPNEYDDDN